MQGEKSGMRFWERNAISTKIIIIGILTLLLLIPASMIQNVITEREQRNTEVSREIGSKWGLEQTVTGPMILVPYLEEVVTKEGHTITHQRELYLLPDRLDVTADVAPDTRYRGIYEVVVYSSRNRMRGSFDLNLLRQSGVSADNILFDKASILLGLSDMKGIREKIAAQVNGEAIEMNPGAQGNVVASSVGAPATGLKALKALSFDFDIDLNGNGQLRFVPIGKETRVTMGSTWSSPSFTGAFLPVEREVSASGFKASWKVLHFNRALPQVWTNRDIDMEQHAFGVSFMVPADIYQQSTRTTKYAIMFIGFTFSAFFLSEVLNRKRIHPVQYLLIGLALVLFYVLLISLSEHLTFALAYLLATIAVIALIASYAVSVLKSRRMGGVVATILAGLYGYLYVLINLEDYSLLLGSIGLFLFLSAIMHLTRRIDWYASATDAC